MVDNASDDGTAALLAAHPSKPHVLRLPRNTGYAGALAIAVKQLETPLMAWLNDDAEPEPGWLETLEDTLGKSPLAAAATALLVLPGGTVQSAGVRLTADGHGADLTEPTGEVFGFCGGAALLRVDALRAVGGVPAGFFCYYEDTDTAWRLRLAALGRRRGARRPGPARSRRQQQARLGAVPPLERAQPAADAAALRPRGVALNQVARFAVLTAVLPLRGRPAAANFRFGLRCRVLAEVGARLPATLLARRRIGRRAALGRGAVWEAWAGL